MGEQFGQNDQKLHEHYKINTLGAKLWGHMERVWGGEGGEGRAELNGGIFLARVGVAGDIILGKYGNANLVL